MKINLTVLETLIWYDYPQLFVAKDPIGGLHLCLATDDSGEIPEYLVVAISAERLQALRLRKIDLFSAFAEPELGAWYKLVSIEENMVVIEPMFGVSTVPANLLPKPGAYLPQQAILLPETFDAVKIGAVAKEAGMNPTLLRQYISGTKRPSTEQLRRVQDAIHRVGERLIQLRLV